MLYGVSLLTTIYVHISFLVVAFSSVEDAKKQWSGYDLVEAVGPYFKRNGDDMELGIVVLRALANIHSNFLLKHWREIGLPESHFLYFDENKDGILDLYEAAKWYFQRGLARTMDLSELSNPPRGHLQRLGAWKDPLPHDHLVYKNKDEFPHPRDFWRKHVDGYLPALFKGAQLGWPCMNWTRDQLADRFGWVQAKLEPKIEARGDAKAHEDVAAFSDDQGRLTLSEFLEVEQGRNLYVVSIIADSMTSEVAYPSSFLCGSRRFAVDSSSPPPYTLKQHPYPHEHKHEWMTHLYEANLWVATGRTSSQLHTDKEWAVNCLLFGSKRWILINPFATHEGFQWYREGKFEAGDPLKNKGTDWVYLDPNSVDLIVQHQLRHMDFYEIIQEAGDCVFLPYFYIHQVEKLDEEYAVAVLWTFTPETIYDEEACQQAPLAKEGLPLAAMDVLFPFSGQGAVPQGYAEPQLVLQNLAAQMAAANATHLSWPLFVEAVPRGSMMGSSVDFKSRAKFFFDALSERAEDPRLGLRKDELYALPGRFLAKLGVELDIEGPLPCDVGKEYFMRSEEFTKKSEAIVQEYLRTTRKNIDKRKDKASEILSIGAEAPRRVWNSSFWQPQSNAKLEL